MQIQKEVYWSECNGAKDPGRTCESSSMCRAQYPHPSEGQQNCLVEHVVYVVSLLCFSQRGQWGQHGDAWRCWLAYAQRVPAYLLRQHTCQRTFRARWTHDCRIVAGYYQSDRDIETGRRMLSTGGEGATWRYPAGPWALAGWLDPTLAKSLFDNWTG